MRYRDAIRNASIEWKKGGLFRSKSSESQAAVDAIDDALLERTDELLSGLVNWLVDLSWEKPHRFSGLQPIKAKCKLRDLLNAALLIAEQPIFVKPKPKEKPQEKPKKKRRPVVSQTSVQPTKTTTITPTITTTTNVQPKPKPIVVIQPQVEQSEIVVVPKEVRKSTRYLLNDCVERSGGNVLDIWTQTSICARLGINKAKFEGFCAAATGRWLKSGDIKSFKGTKGTIDTLHLQTRYESGEKSEEEFYISECGLEGFVASSKPDFLTAEKVFKTLESHKGATKHLLAVVPLSKGDGHAIGITTGDVYHFLDVNEGLACLPDRSAFWTFLWHYIHDPDMGLLNQDYGAFWIASWA